MKPVKVHTVTLNDEIGGESLILHTSYHDANEGRGNKPGEALEVFATQELILCSYTNSASFQLQYYFNPDALRRLANELEAAMIQAQHSS